MAKKRDKNKPSSKGYSVGDWKGITKYNCDYCFFDSFNEEEIKTHVQGHINTQKSPEKRAVPIKDRFGNHMVDQYGEKLYKYI